MNDLHCLEVPNRLIHEYICIFIGNLCIYTYIYIHSYVYGYTKELNLSCNSLSGDLQKNVFQNLINIKRLDISFNEFRGAIPINIFKNNSKLIELNLSGNSFCGLFPTLKNLINLQVSF
jgi:hypothetical protein